MLFPRKDDDCNGDDSECLKPVEQDTLTITLAVIIPVVVVILVLGFFLLKNYKKNRKEDLERDPDFDENGEGTALPDFPAHYPAPLKKQMEMEDPFDNRNSIRYPMNGAGVGGGANRFQGSQDDLRSGKSLGTGPPGRYMDSVVLPYQHDIGSKVSLDEYAKKLGGYDPAHMMNNTPRGSTYVSRTRNSSISNLNSLNPKNTSVSPQKSSLRHETNTEGETHNEDQTLQPPPTTARDYDYDQVKPGSGPQGFSTIPDNSMAENDTTFDANDVTVTDLDSDVTGPPPPNFGVHYENETSSTINEGLNRQLANNKTTETFNTTKDHFDEEEEQENTSPHHDFTAHKQSPFDDTQDLSTPAKQKLLGHDDLMLRNVSHDVIDGDFDFSNESGSQGAGSMVNNEQDTANTSATNLEIPDSSQQRKSPRISAFNLLKNDSDDEDGDENQYEGNKAEARMSKLNPGQEEELKRMKSVYKLYFDHGTSTKPRKDVNMIEEDEHETSHDFEPGPEVPEMDSLKINKDLKTDADYDKRLTTTSSVYLDNFGDEEQQYNYYLQDQNFQQFYQQHREQNPQFYYPQNYSQNYNSPPPPPAVQEPMQHLPHPSDIRKSTIQTYTNFQPRTKGVSATSPPMKQPFNPIENQGVWNQTSPTMNSGRFMPPSSNGMSPEGMSSAPSASQLARSSVSMLNPVTEITKQRKFKPAGSLPSAHTNNHIYASYGHQSEMYNQQGRY